MEIELKNTINAMNITSKEVKERIIALGADLCGIANVERFTAAPEGFHPLDVLPTCKSVIVIGHRFLRGTLACKSSVPYTVVRNILSDKLDRISVQFCDDMEKLGILAIPTGCNGPSEFDERTQRQRNIVSGKHAAELAGLGRIGRNTLLITPEFGNLVWLCVILTEAELEPDQMIEKDLCRGCMACVNACPVSALGTPEDTAGAPLSSYQINQSACWNYAFGPEGRGNWKIKCYRCRAICPWNKPC